MSGSFSLSLFLSFFVVLLLSYIFVSTMSKSKYYYYYNCYYSFSFSSSITDYQLPAVNCQLPSSTYYNYQSYNLLLVLSRLLVLLWPWPWSWAHTAYFCYNPSISVCFSQTLSLYLSISACCLLLPRLLSWMFWIINPHIPGLNNTFFSFLFCFFFCFCSLVSRFRTRCTSSFFSRCFNFSKRNFICFSSGLVWFGLSSTW